MTEFDKSRWAEPDFSSKFVESADIIIVERKRSHAIMKSFFRHAYAGNETTGVLDLGCGDGILTYELKQTGLQISATLVDGSQEMLGKAKARLTAFNDVITVQATFQEIIGKNMLTQDFDFIVSSLAIHHLEMKEKRELFRWIYSHLRKKGCFMNIDVVLAPNEVLEEWYLALWQEWISEKKAAAVITGDIFDDTMKRYKDNRDNKPDTLDTQLQALKTAGFRDVDCYYKYGIFTIYGGRK
jgi:tRNA (cmo5U34)-methyltransferase